MDYKLIEVEQGVLDTPLFDSEEMTEIRHRMTYLSLSKEMLAQMVQNIDEAKRTYYKKLN